MVKIQPCNKGCKKLITVAFNPTFGKYAPYDVDQSGEIIKDANGLDQLHDCPNSQYKKEQNQQGQVTESAKGVDFGKLILEHNKTQQTGINGPSLEATLLNQTSQKIDQLQNQLNDLKYFTEQQIHILLQKNNELLAENLEVSKNTNMMGDAIVAHLKLTEPKKASELYQEPKPEESV